MNLLLNSQETNKKSIRKEVKKMKRIYALTAVIFFLLGGMSVFALDMTSGITTTQTSSLHIEYIYNAYGVSISSTQVTTTTTRSSDGEGGWSETTTLQTTLSTWKGGSLKIDKLTGASDTESSDDANSHTDFVTNYTYNADGQLSGASGSSATKGDRGKDANGQAIGTFESSSVDNYIIKNGQALRSSSISVGTNYGPDGTRTSSFGETTNYTYELKGGSWHLMREVSVSNSNSPDGSTESITKTREYKRDANGVATGITQTASGTSTQVNENGGRTTYTMQNYQATFAYDSKVGWYLSKESWDWVDSTPTPPARGADPAISGRVQLINGELYAFVDTITDENGSQSGEGRVVKIIAAEGQEAEFEALKQLVTDNGGTLTGYTIFGVYQGEGAEDYTAQTFIFQGIGYGSFQP